VVTLTVPFLVFVQARVAASGTGSHRAQNATIMVPTIRREQYERLTAQTVTFTRTR
jgi:hypothetical protein